MANDWNGGTSPGTIGLLFFPDDVRSGVITPTRALALTVPSTQTQTLANLYVGIAASGQALLEVYTAGAEIPGAVTTDTFRPSADAFNGSSAWENQAGSTSNIYQSIDEATLDLADYIVSTAPFSSPSDYGMNFPTSGWGTGRRVLGGRLNFVAGVSGNTPGRMNVRSALASPPASSVPGFARTVTLTSEPTFYSIPFGEVAETPTSGLDTWFEATVESMAAGSTTFYFSSVSGTSVGLTVYQVWLEIDWVTENRLAVGAVGITVADPPNWDTVALVNPTSGAANWAKASGVDYSILVRPFYTPGTAFTVLQLQTLSNGVTPLPTGAEPYTPRLTSTGTVLAMGDSTPATMAIAGDISASATDSADFQPYVIGAMATDNQDLNGAAAGTYRLLRMMLSVPAAADDTEILTWSILGPGPVTLQTGVLTAAQIRAEQLVFEDVDLVPGGTATPGNVYLVELDVSVTLAAATTYQVALNSTSLGGWALYTATDTSSATEQGSEASYGGTALDYGQTYADLPVTLSTIPAAVTGLDVHFENYDTSNLGCNPTLIPYNILAWDATSLGVDFGYYEVQFSVDGGEWQDKGHITDELATTLHHKEFPFGLPVTYRIRVVRTGDLIPSVWTETAPLTVEGECVYYLTSDLWDVQLAYNPGDKTTWTFPSADETLIAPRAGANYQQALISSEWRGDVFEVDLSVWLPNQANASTIPPGGPKRWSFDALIALSRAPVPYVCVRDETGRVWYANVTVDEATQNSGAAVPNNTATVVITELPNTPAVIDVEPTPMAAATWWVNAAAETGWESGDPWTDQIGVLDGDALPVVSQEDVGPVLLLADEGTGAGIRLTTSTFAGAGIEAPDSAALSITGDIMLRSQMRAIGDASVGGTEDRTVGIMKTVNTGPNPDFPGYEHAILLTGQRQMIWVDGSNVQQTRTSTRGGLNVYDHNEILTALDVNDGGTHTVTFYERDDAGTFQLNDGSRWSVWDEVNSAGTTSIANTTGTLFVCAFRQVGTLHQVYNSVANGASPVADFNPGRDCTGIISAGGTMTSSTTGETYTVSVANGCAITPVDGSGYMLGMINVDTTLARFDFGDNPVWDVPVGESFSWAVRFRPEATGVLGNQWFAKVSGTLGAGGTGWATLDVTGFGGFGAALSDGTNTAVALATAPAADLMTVVVSFTRGGTIDCYIDGVLFDSSSASTVALAVANATDLILTGTLTHLGLYEAAATFDRDLTAAQAATVYEDLTDTTAHEYAPFLFVP